MSNEFKRMQELAGVPVTEAITPKKKKSLKENFVGFGAINNPFLEREKTDYEMAFDHYVNKTHLKEEESPVSEEASNSEVRLSNEILNFLEERGIIDPSDAQKVHKALTSFLKSKTPTPDRILSKSDYINGIRSKSDYIDGIEENENPTDEIKLDVPLLIRLLEYAREDAKTDMDLHNVAERLIDLSRGGECLGMVDYEAIVGGPEEGINEGFGSFLNKVKEKTGMLADVMSIVVMAKEDKEGAADKAVQMMMDKYRISQEEALQAVTIILKKFGRWVE